MTALAHEIPRPGPASALAAALQARIPVLTTDRLTLRAPRLEDFALHAEIACSPRGAGIGGPMSRGEAWADFIQLTGTWLLRGHGAWTVTEGGTPVGFVLIGFEPGDEEPELGYMFTEAAEGRGLAQEAARAVIAHARDALKMTTLVSCVALDNDRSARLAERLGATRDAVVEATGDGATRIYRYDLTKGSAP
ncbi:GNAT family N-acetyltransferase [Psychromarinibacter sp. C21-152]|uniref:GNAT family N-acetyltransferase n=1 Tax=Psychromarinibacter sediminicola TaxID=3033385 RepID=A0AAE3NTG7_9RHOB|nr:GNAT family N-acetyltransferase [Psychromarinibacter sediminicola]MDF0601767.1 GNAT family N-acetyltransferase [Psychromarinibacter sediminicola]